MRHVLEVDDLSEAELAEILDLASVGHAEATLAGRGVALIFEKPSNRTRNACEMAVVALGGHPVVIRGDEIGLGERESVEDVTRVLARYHAIVCARVFEHRHLEAMAAVGEVPIVNLLSERSHPTQALADLLTLRSLWGSFVGRRLAWVGDGNNVARSLVLAASMVGLDVALACPAGFELNREALCAAKARGIAVTETTLPGDAVADADAVCTDVWVSMGQEAQGEQRLQAFDGFRVTEALMDGAAPDAVFMHCLPAHRGMEVDAAVIDGPRSVVWDQAENRMHAARALLQWLSKQ